MSCTTDPKSTGRITLQLVLLIALMIGAPSAKAQNAWGYHTITGHDPSLWEDMTSGANTEFRDQAVELPFKFYFMGYLYNEVKVTQAGMVRFCTPSSPNLSEAGNRAYFSPYYSRHRPVVFALNADWKWKVLGTPGNRVFVCEVKITFLSWAENLYYQVRLAEANNQLTITYQPTTTAQPSAVTGSCMLCGQQRQPAYINDTGAWNSRETQMRWPDSNKFYTFIPDTAQRCAATNFVRCRQTGPGQVLFWWDREAQDSCYRVRYASSDEAAETELITVDTFVQLPLNRGQCWFVKLNAVCQNGQDSPDIRYRYNNIFDNNAFVYWDLTAPNTNCYSTGHPGRVDYGPEDINLSCHTVHSNAYEYDEETRYQMPVVPCGYTHTVRLGNNLADGGIDKIRYTIDVDTDLFSLLMVNYALVQQDPTNHHESEKPRFSLKITNNSGTVISNCYDINFISGLGDSYWHNGQPGTKWHNWQTIGIDLSSLHGQRIRVEFENRDCSLGGHFGYSYFCMRGEKKEIKAEVCGNGLQAVLRAPSGFIYRWFRPDDPETTLGTSDTLLATGGGTFSCECKFTHNPECGFTINVTPIPQYPRSLFTYDTTNLDMCHHEFRFHNHSAIALDSNLTQITDQPCHSFLWTFDDGTTSREENPTHVFTSGSHWAELSAMLNNGQCSHVSRQEFSMPLEPVTLSDSMCAGGTYTYNGFLFDTPGEHHFETDCYAYTLHLSTYNYSHHEIADTVCEGETYHLGNGSFATEGHHLATLTAANGCDSTIGISLHLRPLPSKEVELFHSCHGEAYYYYKSELQLADSAYQVAGSQTYISPDGIIVRWTPQDTSSPMPYYWNDSILRVDVVNGSTYYLYYTYTDQPQCPTNDTVVLFPADKILADMQLWPEHLNSDHLDFWAQDLSLNSNKRKWLIDGILQADTTRRLYASARPDADSVVVKLIAYNNSCQDSTEGVLAVQRHLLMFPNVFTPTQGINNTFGPVYNNVNDYELWIYDRRGALVFHTTDILQSWNGTHNGTPCRQETYVYTCTYTTVEYGPGRQVGTVTLLR